MKSSLQIGQQDDNKRESGMEIDASIPDRVEERMILKEIEQNIMQGVVARGSELKKGHHESWKRRAREGKQTEN